MKRTVIRGCAMALGPSAGACGFISDTASDRGRPLAPGMDGGRADTAVPGDDSSVGDLPASDESAPNLSDGGLPTVQDVAAPAPTETSEPPHDSVTGAETATADARPPSDGPLPPADDGSAAMDANPMPPDLPLVHHRHEGRQWGGEVAALADGGFVVVWGDFGYPELGDGRVWARTWGADGTPREEPRALVPDDPDRQAFPAVAGLAEGGYVVVWPRGVVEEVSRFDISGVVVDADGAVGEPVQLSTLGRATQGDPALCRLSGGDLVMTWGWWTYDGSSDGVVSRILRPSLAPVGANRLPAEHTDDAQSRPRCAPLPSGGYVLTWDSTITRGYDVRLRFFDERGDPTTPELAGNPWDTSGVQRGGRPVALDDERVLVVYGKESYGFKVVANLIDREGDVVWSGEVAPDLVWRSQPAVAARAGGAQVFLQARTVSEQPSAIMGVDWDAAGPTLRDPVELWRDAEFQSAPEAATLTGGERVVVWTCTDDDNEGTCMRVIR